MIKVLNMKTHFIFNLIWVSCVGGLFAQPAIAGGHPQNSSITSQAFQNAKGAVRVNIAAGTGNEQTNVGSITMGSDGVGGVNVLQSSLSGFPLGGNFTALIEGQAFSGVEGLLQVNQASGSNNLEANVANMVSIGVTGSKPLTPISLDQISTETSNLNIGPFPGSEEHKVGISANAFHGSNGVLQVSQVAGSTNFVSNSFSLQIKGVVP